MPGQHSFKEGTVCPPMAPMTPMEEKEFYNVTQKSHFKGRLWQRSQP
jgi:hypothetical protein